MKLFIVFLSFVTWAIGIAQVPNYLGIRGGVSFSSFSSNGLFTNVNNKGGSSPAFTISYQHSLGNVFTFQPEINFHNRIFSFLFLDTRTIHSMGSGIDLALFLKATYPLSDYFEFSILASPYIARGLTGKFEENGVEQRQKYFDYFNLWDFGLKGGGSIAWILPSRRKLELDIRYATSFSNALKPETQYNPIRNTSGYFSLLDITLGFYLPLNR